jgi:hypothetical protein
MTLPAEIVADFEFLGQEWLVLYFPDPGEEEFEVWRPEFAYALSRGVVDRR